MEYAILGVVALLIGLGVGWYLGGRPAAELKARLAESERDAKETDARYLRAYAELEAAREKGARAPRVGGRRLELADAHAHAQRAARGGGEVGAADEAEPRRVEQRGEARAAVDVVAGAQRGRGGLRRGAGPRPGGGEGGEGVAVGDDVPVEAPRPLERAVEQRRVRDARHAVERGDGRHGASERGSCIALRVVGVERQAAEGAEQPRSVHILDGQPELREALGEPRSTILGVQVSERGPC